MGYTNEELKDAAHVIACLMFEYYDKKDILNMYPQYAEIYEQVQGQALAEAMALVKAMDKSR